MNLQPGHAALKKGRTVFLKSVKAPGDVSRLLQPAKTNTKMGKGKNVIERGRWRGMPLYLLSLEERATCPRSCQQWSNCYGNNMPFANRIDHRRGEALARGLRVEVEALAKKHPRGFVVRLHVLGDFFSKAYVGTWRTLLESNPALHIYGYTHRYPEQKDGIGKAVAALNHPDRCWIRFSDRGGEMSANAGAAIGPGDIQCPEEVGKTDSCLTCGLCWQTTKPIKFLPH